MRYCGLILSLFLLAGCSSLLTSSDNVRYFFVLNPIADKQLVARQAPIRFSVQTPTMPDWLNSSHITLRPTPYQIDFYAGARWASQLNLLLDDAISQSLLNNYVMAELQSAPNLKPSYALQTYVTHFEAQYVDKNTPPVIFIQMQCKLLSAQGNTLYQFVVESQAPAQRDRLTDIIEAFEIALENALSSIVIETAKGLQQAR